MGMSMVAMHLAEAIWNTSVAEKDHKLVDRLGILRRIVPEEGGIVSRRQMRRRIPLLRMDEVRELGWIADKKRWSVIAHKVKVALRRSKLD